MLIKQNDQLLGVGFIILKYNTVKPVFKGHLNIPEKVSLHDGCPFVTGSLTWGRYDTVLRKCPLITGCPLIAVSLEDGFYFVLTSTSNIPSGPGLVVHKLSQINRPLTYEPII